MSALAGSAAASAATVWLLPQNDLFFSIIDAGESPALPVPIQKRKTH
jgi:hypothetical protein